jgi:hypothetical protein
MQTQCFNHRNNLSFLCVYVVFFVTSYCQIISKIEAVRSHWDGLTGYWIYSPLDVHATVCQELPRNQVATVDHGSNMAVLQVMNRVSRISDVKGLNSMPESSNVAVCNRQIDQRSNSWGHLTKIGHSGEGHSHPNIDQRSTSSTKAKTFPPIRKWPLKCIDQFDQYPGRKSNGPDIIQTANQSILLQKGNISNVYQEYSKLELANCIQCIIHM